MEKLLKEAQVGKKVKWGRVSGSRVSRKMMLAKLMETQTWCPLALG